jgi:hypothetical protein
VTAGETQAVVSNPYRCVGVTASRTSTEDPPSVCRNRRPRDSVTDGIVLKRGWNRIAGLGPSAFRKVQVVHRDASRMVFDSNCYVLCSHSNPSDQLFAGTVPTIVLTVELGVFRIRPAERSAPTTVR